MTAYADTFKFPIPPRAAATGGSRIEKAGSRIRRGLYRLASRLGLPACVRPINLHDELSGQSLAVRMSETFTIISMNGRDFYFDRLTGRFDGTGAGCR